MQLADKTDMVVCSHWRHGSSHLFHTLTGEGLSVCLLNVFACVYVCVCASVLVNLSNCW